METCVRYNEHSIIDTSIPSILSLEELLVSPNKYKHIYIGDLLNFISVNTIIPTINQIKSKLEKGGQLTIEEYDQYVVCSNIVNDNTTSADFNNIINPRTCLLSIPDVLNILSQSQMRIIEKDIDANKHLIKAINE